jgi:hypothetical protein
MAERPYNHYNALFRLTVLQEGLASVGRYVAARVG